MLVCEDGGCSSETLNTLQGPLHISGLLTACKLGSKSQKSKADSNSLQAFIQKSQNIISAHSLIKTSHKAIPKQRSKVVRGGGKVRFYFLL